MVESALRGVVREALAHVAEKGLPGDHHFYLTFVTNHRGVAIPDYLRQKYPQEMTIVLQHQFFGLEVCEDRFSVSLSFSSKTERLVIPLAAITTFADPSVNFALQFQSAKEGSEDEESDAAEAPDSAPEADAKAPAEAAPADGAKVVALDAFRKK
ncbi:SspB family protein [Inquilinus sp. Marseille-Q2685]|uniref:SspB family protein n=1 Tax=Inquilinus sp. Marseille-Q2685 TaxID=2866581 RepID=UPI001CE46401|nr:ClpXP protease specificity-enhancing factor SspB [Inquilinus sp. Marseille-Q2685]